MLGHYQSLNDVREFKYSTPVSSGLPHERKEILNLIHSVLSRGVGQRGAGRKKNWETVVKLLANEQLWLIKELRPNCNNIECCSSFQTSLSPYHLYLNILPGTEC